MIYKHIGIVKGISQVVLPGFLSEDRVEEASCLPSMRFFAWLGEDELRSQEDQPTARKNPSLRCLLAPLYMVFLFIEGAFDG
jgi:hypothetical protein